MRVAHIWAGNKLLEVEGEFLKLVLVLNTLWCETTTLSVLHEIRQIFSAHLVVHLLSAYETDEVNWLVPSSSQSFVE